MKKTLAVVAAWTLLACGPAQASDLSRSLTVCAAATGSVERLACFDKVVRDNNLQPTTTTSSQQSAWAVRQSTSRLDDSRTVTASTPSVDAFHTRYGQARYAHLYVRCLEGRFETIVAFGEYLGVDRTSVTHRIDKRDPVTSFWSMSTNHSSVFSPNPRQLASEIARGATMVVRTTPYGENPILVEFDLTGSAAAIAQVREACPQ